MKTALGSEKVVRILSLPKEQRKGLLGYLIEQWEKSAKAHAMGEQIQERIDAELNRAKTQTLKAHGAMEAIERMIEEQEEPIAGSGAKGEK